MSKRRFSLVTGILLLLLIAAVANNFFIYHAYHNAMSTVAEEPQGKSGTQNAFLPPTPSYRPRIVAGAQPAPPPWYGDVYLSKAAGGGYDVVVEAFARGTRTLIKVDALELDVRRPGSPAPQSLTPTKRDQDGRYVAHADIPGGGTWEVRVRMHFGNEALEFAEKFDLKD